MASSSSHTILRRETAAEHAEVDELFSRFDFASPASYGAFLATQAIALLPLEAALSIQPGLPPWRPRGVLLREDLAQLGRSLPDAGAIARPASRAHALGMLYVLEGSRLGGGVLIERIGSSLPRNYLGARHLHGEWRCLLRAFGSELSEDAKLGQAVAGAKAAFHAFITAGERFLDFYPGNAADEPEGNIDPMSV